MIVAVWWPALVHWPSERERRAQLADAGIPRVLLVAEGASPPDDMTDEEDWVRLPASEQDVSARLHNLGQRVRNTLRLDDRVLRSRRGAVTLAATEAAVVAVLLDHHDHPTPSAELAVAAGLDEGGDRHPLYDVMHRVRQRIRPLGLDVFNAPGRGYVIGLRLDQLDADEARYETP
jgi:two-component system, OmpR family, response regulator